MANAAGEAAKGFGNLFKKLSKHIGNQVIPELNEQLSGNMNKIRQAFELEKGALVSTITGTAGEATATIRRIIDPKDIPKNISDHFADMVESLKKEGQIIYDSSITKRGHLGATRRYRLHNATPPSGGPATTPPTPSSGTPKSDSYVSTGAQSQYGNHYAEREARRRQAEADRAFSRGANNSVDFGEEYIPQAQAPNKLSPKQRVKINQQRRQREAAQQKYKGNSSSSTSSNEIDYYDLYDDIHEQATHSSRRDEQLGWSYIERYGDPRTRTPKASNQVKEDAFSWAEQGLPNNWNQPGPKVSPKQPVQPKRQAPEQPRTPSGSTPPSGESGSSSSGGNTGKHGDEGKLPEARRPNPYKKKTIINENGEKVEVEVLKDGRNPDGTLDPNATRRQRRQYNRDVNNMYDNIRAEEEAARKLDRSKKNTQTRSLEDVYAHVWEGSLGGQARRIAAVEGDNGQFKLYNVGENNILTGEAKGLTTKDLAGFDPDNLSKKLVHQQLPQTSWFKDSNVAQSISTWTTEHPYWTGAIGVGGFLLAAKALDDD